MSQTPNRELIADILDTPGISEDSLVPLRVDDCNICPILKTVGENQDFQETNLQYLTRFKYTEFYNPRPPGIFRGQLIYTVGAQGPKVFIEGLVGVESVLATNIFSSLNQQ